MEILCLFVKAIGGRVSAKMLDFHRLSLFCTHGYGGLELYTEYITSHFQSSTKLARFLKFCPGLCQNEELCLWEAAGTRILNTLGFWQKIAIMQLSFRYF